jgi:hypothetical protein
VHYTLACALQLREKHGKTSVRIAACTSQAVTAQYKKNEQLNTQKGNSNTDAEDVAQGTPHGGFSG